MVTDPIADYLTRLRNALRAGHRVLEVGSSRVRQEISRVLQEQGYIKSYRVLPLREDEVQPRLELALKYDGEQKQPSIEKLIRISKPGLRHYCASRSLPHVYNGLGIAILSTSQGIMTDKEARRRNIGGEVLCHVY